MDPHKKRKNQKRGNMIAEEPSADSWSSQSESHLDSPKLVRCLLQVGSQLFSKGFEKDALAMFESAQSVLHSNLDLPSESALKHLEMGSQLLVADEAIMDEAQFNSPDLYLEDECDVGPRVLRSPAHFDIPSQYVESNVLLDCALSFNKALIFHDNLDFTEAKKLYQSVLNSLQTILLSSIPGIPAKLLLELGTRAHNNIGHIAYLGGEEDVAKSHFEASLLCARQLADYSKDHRLVYASVLSNWCRVCWMKGDVSDNIHNALREVLRVRSSLLRWNHEDVAAAHYNIAVAEYARRRNQNATSHLIQYLHISSDHAQSKRDDLDPIPALIYLLLIQNEEKDDNLSQELVRGLRTLQDKRQDQGPDSPEVASVLNFIGTLLFHKEDHSNALLFFQEELRLEENVPGCAEDISVSVTCNNIGRILQELGKLTAAIHYYHKALKPRYGEIPVVGTSKSAYAVHVSGTGATDCHPSSANLYSTVWYNLGLIHDKLGSYRDAISAFERSLELRRAMLGGDHPDIACLMYNIGVLQMEQQLLNEATDSFREALRIRRGGATGQLNDKHVVKTLEKLSSLHKAKGNLQGALEALEDVLRIQELSQDYDPSSRLREIGITLRSMAELHHATRALDEALAVSAQSVLKLRPLVMSASASSDVSAVEHLVSSLLFIGSLYHELCDPLKACGILSEALDTLERCRSEQQQLHQQFHHRTQACSSSLQALHEVTAMIATAHCAAQA